MVRLTTDCPVLEDFPRDAPPVDREAAAACPVSFVRDADDDRSWQARLGREISALRPWYELSRRRRGGRTLVGLSDRTPEQNLERLGKHLDECTLPTDTVWLKRAVEDVRAYYTEAMTAQPGEYDSRALQTRFWQESTFGAAILALYHQFQSSDDDGLKLMARILAPREAVGAATGPGGGGTNG